MTDNKGRVLVVEFEAKKLYSGLNNKRFIQDLTEDEGKIIKEYAANIAEKYKFTKKDLNSIILDVKNCYNRVAMGEVGFLILNAVVSICHQDKKTLYLLRDSVINEMLCKRLMKRYGLDTHEAQAIATMLLAQMSFETIAENKRGK